jgi:hypothetical protein
MNTVFSSKIEQDQYTKRCLVAALSTMLGIAEADCLDDTSNVWRSAMIDARSALSKALMT